MSKYIDPKANTYSLIEFQSNTAQKNPVSRHYSN